jgi:hypothetical protein
MAMIAVGVIAFNFYGARNPDYACFSVQHDWGALGVDVNELGGREGDWWWWPVGLACSFPLVGGGLIWVGPDPVLSIVLLAGITGIASGLVGAIALTANRRRRTQERNKESV